ncbi:Coiled-coil domain-containing protein 92 [Taenia solium]|eukprot:TsM_000376700 transcript=TsM_000376700 gene=TsM_000376700
MATMKTELNGGADVRAEPATNENEMLSVHRANQIFTLQKNIEFLKKNHQEMLMTLHNEVERLKKSNCELQHMLILERKSVKPAAEDTDVTIMMGKIRDLEAQLQTAQQKNELLKKELESRKRFKFANRHVVAESHSPIIQKAEKVRKTGSCLKENTSTIVGDSPSDLHQKWAENSSFCAESHMDLGKSSLKVAIPETLHNTPLPPIVQHEFSDRSTSRLSLVSPGHHTTPTYTHWTPSSHPRASATRRMADSKACLVPLKLIPPMPMCSGLQHISAAPATVDLKLTPQTTSQKVSFTSALRPILTGLPAKPPTIRVYPKGDNQTLMSTKGDSLSYPEEPLICSRDATHRPQMLSSLRQTLHGSLRPLVRRKLNSKDSKKHLF